MEAGGGSDRLGTLRQTIARIEGDRRAVCFSQERDGMRFGAGTALDPGTELDAALGGLPRGTLHEVLAASPGDAPAASGFTLALAARFAAARAGAAVVWIVDEQAKRETGGLYAPGLAAYGLDPARLLVIEVAGGQEGLWAMEEALRCRTLAVVVAEVWRLKAYDLAASRRLVLAAARSGTPGLLVPAGAAGAAARFSSAAWTRFELRAAPGPHAASAAARVPLPGRAAWDVRVARIRAGPGGRALALDPHRFWPVLWDHEGTCFRDAFPVLVPAPARHGPHPARTARDAAAPLARIA